MKNITNINQEGENIVQAVNLLSQNVLNPENHVCETEQAKTSNQPQN